MEGLARYHVTTDQFHGWILIGALLSQDWARENRMIAVLSADIDFDLFDPLIVSFKYNGANNVTLTGNSSLAFHMPETCLCTITCFIFSKAGKDMQPTLTLNMMKN